MNIIKYLNWLKKIIIFFKYNKQNHKKISKYKQINPFLQALDNIYMHSH